MYEMLVKLMFIAALMQIGISGVEFSQCVQDRNCMFRIQKASREVLKVDWKPIIIFPKESKRFR
jgi:hypothetical protein